MLTTKHNTQLTRFVVRGLWVLLALLTLQARTCPSRAGNPQLKQEGIMANAIQKRNDEFRLNVLTQPQRRGKCIVTRGFDALDVPTKKKAIEAVKNFSDFTEDNDPHREHDFGEIVLDGTSIFWKIDYYESEKMEYGTDDLINAYRVLILMLADEY